ncbi:MAG: hypothetical protein ACFCU1_01935 [Sumerlaeia bacterium]
MSLTEENTQPIMQPSERRYWEEQLSRLFSFDELHVRQKVFTLAQKYFITDAENNLRFFVLRPPKLAANLGIGLIFTVLRFSIFILAINLILFQAQFILGIVVLVVSNFVLGFSIALLAPYRHIEIFTDDSMSWRVLMVTQDNKLALYREYTLYDSFGEPVCVMSRNVFASMFRRDWWIETPSGEFLVRVREDSLIRSLLRRYLGPMYGLLMTNFNFEDEKGTILGVFDRKFTLTDQYSLKMQGDLERTIDRRVCLAMSILLDTAESR